MGKVIKEVAGGVLRREGKILVMRRAPFLSWAGSWEFPGGKLEHGETPQQCLERELFEELNIRARAGAFLAENRHQYDFGEVHLMVYEVPSWEGEIALTVHDAMQWVRPSDLADVPGLLPADVPVAHALEAIFAEGAAPRNNS